MPRKANTRASKRTRKPKQVETTTHKKAKRTNIPTAEYASALRGDGHSPLQVAYERRNPDLDPQLVWRGKEEQDAAGLSVQAPPLFIQEKVHPKVLIDDLIRETEAREPDPLQPDLFADFNGLPEDAARTDFYAHDANWSNRMILGDSLQVMSSLAEREGLRGRVQCIYLDPPYGIKFNSNFQWSTTSRDVRDGNLDHITREPEQVKAFRDTWRDGIHSYLSYLRDRLIVARDLLTESGSIFVQIGDENVHRVRALMDEVFGDRNHCLDIIYQKTTYSTSSLLPKLHDYVLWYARSIDTVKYRQLNLVADDDELDETFRYRYVESLSGPKGGRSIERRYSAYDVGRFLSDNITSPGGSSYDDTFVYEGDPLRPGPQLHWKTDLEGMTRLGRAGRLFRATNSLRYCRLPDDALARPLKNIWTDTTVGSFADPKAYVVQTTPKVVERCLLMATAPGDLVLDPTCGSGTTAYVAEQWGRRWITIDTSRVALALARARIMGARYPYYLLKDSPEGQRKEAEVTQRAPADAPTGGDIRQGFVYQRVPHITLKSIANNAEIDEIWEQYQETLEPLREQLNQALGESWEEWEIPREPDKGWAKQAVDLHADWWEQRIARQRAIDASISAQADYEFLYDKPYEDNTTVRVAGPFTVESLSPHRVLDLDENGEPIDRLAETAGTYGEPQDFATMVLENLRTSGVQQAHKEDRTAFSSLTPWPGELICAEGLYWEGEEESGTERRAAIFVGPEFGTVSRPDLADAAKEAADARFDVLIACAFSYDAHCAGFDQVGALRILQARMNADLHMAADLKNTGQGNLFVIFGEPDVDVLDADDGRVQVRVNGVDVFHPASGEVRSDGPEGIACWFIDTDYDAESFRVRHAYFLGQSDPYKALKTTLKAEIDEEAWASLHSDVSRPFDKPELGRIAVKVINHLGDEVMKVFRVP